MLCFFYKKAGFLILFLITILIIDTSCKKELASSTYDIGDELICIARDGVKMRYNPSTNSDYLGVLKFNEKVDFIKIVKDVGISYTGVNRVKKAEYWLEVNYQGEIIYIHGAALVFGRSFDRDERLNQRHSNSSFSKDTEELIKEDFFVYLTLADVNVRDEKKRSGHFLDEVIAGSVHISEATSRGGKVVGCYDQSIYWINIKKGWSSYTFYHQFSKNDVENIKYSREGYNNDEQISFFYVRKKTPVYLKKTYNSPLLGYADPNIFFVSNKILNGEEVMFCNSTSSYWVKYKEGWVNMIYLTRIPKSEMDKAISFFDL